LRPLPGASASGGGFLFVLADERGPLCGEEA